MKESFATPFVSVVKPFSATTLPSGQLFGLDRSLPGSPSAGVRRRTRRRGAAVQTGQRRPVHLVRRLQLIDLHAALGHLRLAVQRLGLQLQLDRLAVGLPVVGADHRFEGGVADADGAVGGARLARAVGHIGVDLEDEGRLVLLRHLGVRLGGELDLERAIGPGPGRAVGDFLALALRPAAAPPTPPPRHAHLAHDAVFDRRAVHGGAGVVHRVAGEADLLVELRGGLRGIERHLELRPLVFLDPEVGQRPAPAPRPGGTSGP